MISFSVKKLVDQFIYICLSAIMKLCIEDIKLYGYSL